MAEAPASGNKLKMRTRFRSGVENSPLLISNCKLREQKDVSAMRLVSAWKTLDHFGCQVDALGQDSGTWV